jgi:hypothetical protein
MDAVIRQSRARVHRAAPVNDAGQPCGRTRPPGRDGERPAEVAAPHGRSRANRGRGNAGCLREALHDGRQIARANDPVQQAQPPAYHVWRARRGRTTAGGEGSAALDRARAPPGRRRPRAAGGHCASRTQRGSRPGRARRRPPPAPTGRPHGESWRRRLSDRAPRRLSLPPVARSPARDTHLDRGSAYIGCGMQRWRPQDQMRPRGALERSHGRLAAGLKYGPVAVPSPAAGGLPAP